MSSGEDDAVSRALALARAATGLAPLPPGALADSRAAAFDSIHQGRQWGSKGASTSGPGSEVGNAAGAILALIEALHHTGAKSLLDVGCGDFHWLGHTLSQSSALPQQLSIAAVDISPTALNTARQRHPTVAFAELDIVLQRPAAAYDLVLCRQCLNHMTPANVRSALANIAAS